MLDGVIKIVIRRLGKNINLQLWSKKYNKYVKKYLGIDVGYGSYGFLRFPCGTKIGNYCSIAEGVKYLPGNHPINNLSTAACFFNPRLGFVERKYDIERKSLTIGNDVWIGANVTITNGCTKIGNGAIIGAGSVVTHNVEAYSIVCGNPAKILRFRFNDELISLIEKSKWWNLSIDNLLKYKDLMNEPEVCVREILKDNEI